MTFVFENEPDLEDNYLDPNNEQDLQKIILILQKLPSMRTKSELKSLYLLLNKVDFLKDFWANMPSKVGFALLKSLKYEHTQKSQAVFKYGDSEKYFYLILKGSVYVIVPSKEDKDANEELPTPLHLDLDGGETPPVLPTGNPDLNSPADDKTHSHRRAGFFFRDDHHLVKKRSLRRADSHRSSPEASPANFKQKNMKGERALMHQSSFSAAVTQGPLTPESLLALYPNHALLNTLKERDYFGDIALKLHTRRTATVVSREICHFLILDSKAYNNILSDYQDRLQFEMLNFFKSTPLTKDWPSSSLVGMMRHSKVCNMTVNNVIYDFGDPSNQIYFIKQGEVEIIKEAEIDFGKDQNFLNHQRGGSLDRDKLTMLKMNSTWKTKYKHGHTQQIRVALIGANQSFGEEEILNRKKKRQSKAIVKSSFAEIIIIPLSKLVENAKDPEIFRHSLLTKDARSKWREDLETEIIETTHHSLVLEQKFVMPKRKDKVVITVTDNNFSGLKKPPPDHRRLPSLNTEPENLQSGMVTRLMQRELDKKSAAYKDVTSGDTVRSSGQVSQAKSKSPPSSRPPKSPDLLKKLLMQTFENRALYTKGPLDDVSQQLSKDDSLSMNKSYSVSKINSGAQSLEASHIMIQEPPQKPGLNTVDIVSFMASNPSMTTIHRSNHLETAKHSDRVLKSRGLFLSPLRQTGFSKAGKTVATPQGSLVRSPLNERPKIKGLILKELDSIEQKAPPQFFVSTPAPVDANKSFKDDMRETVPFLISPKIKINASSPKLIMKIKSKMKSIDNTAAFLASETLRSQNMFDVSKLNQLIGQQNRHLKARSIDVGKKIGSYNAEAFTSLGDMIDGREKTKYQ